MELPESTSPGKCCSESDESGESGGGGVSRDRGAFGISNIMVIEVLNNNGWVDVEFLRSVQWLVFEV